MKQLESVYRIEEDPYGEINLVDLINKGGSEREIKTTSSTKSLEHSSLRHQIEAIKNKGKLGKLDIYRFHGKMKRKQDWRAQDFQIKNGFLKYFKSNTRDRPHDELDLSKVVYVLSCPSQDKAFHFEIHFRGLGNKGSPWLLRAQTQDDRICWMEAVQSGSSAATVTGSRSAGIYDEPDLVPKKSQRAQGEQKQILIPAVYDEPTVISTQVQSALQNQRKVLPADSEVMYDEPVLTPAQSQKQTKVKNAPPEYDEPFPMPVQVHSVSRNQITTWRPSSQPPLVTEEPLPHERGSDNDSVDSDVYDDYPNELEQEDDDPYYIEITASDSAPSRNATIPRKLESVTEISLENLSNLGPKQAQLWMLLNTQKMVQKMEKMEEVYGSNQSLPRKADRQSMTKPVPPPKPAPLLGNAKEVPAPPNYPPPEEIEEIYDEDIGPELEIVTEPTRQDLYINLDAINEAVEKAPPPPVPPRTYQHIDERDSYRNRTQSEISLHYKKKMPSISRISSKPDGYAQPMVSNTLPPDRRSMVLSGSSSVSAQDIQPPDKRKIHDQSVSAVRQRSRNLSQTQSHSLFGPILQQKRETSEEEMISTLKASSRAILSDIASHLVTDDDDEILYAPGKRPEWAKARTQIFGLEPSLADLHQKALFLPRSTLRNLKEIGRGQYGKVFKGMYKRSEGPGYPVAVKTIRKYESEKEKENFYKEMNVMSKLMHPNIVRLFGIVQQEQPWIVLEYLPHGDLKKFLIKNKKPIDKLLKYMVDVATGMHYISEKGLIHRDLAARNIMVSEDEICKVGDFGLLREIPKDADIYVSQTKTKFPIRWMAPESLMKKEFSPASDVWSFGVIMWEMHNPLELPYKGMNNLQVAVGVNKDLRLHIPEIYPPTVARVMKACWQQSPSKRPSFLLIASLLSSVYFGAE